MHSNHLEAFNVIQSQFMAGGITKQIWGNRYDCWIWLKTIIDKGWGIASSSLIWNSLNSRVQEALNIYHLLFMWWPSSDSIHLKILTMLFMQGGRRRLKLIEATISSTLSVCGWLQCNALKVFKKKLNPNLLSISA